MPNRPNTDPIPEETERERLVALLARAKALAEEAGRLEDLEDLTSWERTCAHSAYAAADGLVFYLGRRLEALPA